MACLAESYKTYLAPSLIHCALQELLSEPTLFMSCIIWSCDPALAQSESIISSVNIETLLKSDCDAYKEPATSMIASRFAIRRKGRLVPMGSLSFCFLRMWSRENCS